MVVTDTPLPIDEIIKAVLANPDDAWLAAWIIDAENPPSGEGRIGKTCVEYKLPGRLPVAMRTADRRIEFVVALTFSTVPTTAWATCYDDDAEEGEPSVCGKSMTYCGRHWLFGNGPGVPEIDDDISSFSMNDCGSVMYCEKVNCDWEVVIA
jgi:hypothetical protein